jgi:hypothetical protein
MISVLILCLLGLACAAVPIINNEKTPDDANGTAANANLDEEQRSLWNIASAVFKWSSTVSQKVNSLHQELPPTTDFEASSIFWIGSCLLSALGLCASGYQCRKLQLKRAVEAAVAESKEQ